MPSLTQAVSFREMVGPLPADELTHSLYPYPARLLRQIPRHFLAEATRQGFDCVIDPFCGSGTVLVEAARVGLASIGFDSNPVATLVARVKTTRLDTRLLLKSARSAVAGLTMASPRRPPRTFVARWYAQQDMIELEQINELVESSKLEEFYDAYRVALALTARDASGTDPRIPVPVRSAHPAGRRPPLNSVKDRFLHHIETIATRVSRLPPSWPTPVVVTADSRDARLWELPSHVKKALMLTSPPYGAAQKYVRSTSLEAGWLHLSDETGTSELELRSIGREHIRKAASQPSLEAIDDTNLQNVLRQIRSSSPARADIYDHYFLDMRQVFTAAASAHQITGIVLIAGTNTVAGSLVETHEHLAQMILGSGYDRTNIFKDEIRGRTLLTLRRGKAEPARAEFVHVFDRAGETSGH